ncbi:MAG: nitronate monooxygenase, partial [Thermodesulfobacteriota bacterium]
SLALGASAVQMGTAFLSCKEARVPKPWLDSLLASEDIAVVLTKAFSGKYARGIKNRFIEEMSSLENEIPSYPLQNSLTRSLRNASRDIGNKEFMSLWAGQGSQMSRQCTAQELIDTLILETSKVLKSVTTNL